MSHKGTLHKGKKRCPQCTKRKRPGEFYKNCATRDGLSVYCRVCVKLRRIEAKKPKPGEYATLTPAQQKLTKVANFLSLALIPLRIEDEEFVSMFLGRSDEADEGIKAIREMIDITMWAIEQGEEHD